MRAAAWTVLVAGPILASGSVEHPWLVVGALTATLAAASWLAWRNGRTTRRTFTPAPVSHVRLVGQPTSPAEDLLRMSWWDAQRSRIDSNGRPTKVGVDRHSRLCVDEQGHVLCVCGLDDRDVAGAVAGGVA